MARRPGSSERQTPGAAHKSMAAAPGVAYWGSDAPEAKGRQGKTQSIKVLLHMINKTMIRQGIRKKGKMRQKAEAAGRFYSTPLV